MDLNILKSEIRSLLVSAPNQLPVAQFYKDYLKQVGVPFPYEKFGFSNGLGLLKRLDDVVSIKNFNGEEILIPVGNSKAGHISDLVRNQKNTPRKPLKANGGRHKSTRGYTHNHYDYAFEESRLMLEEDVFYENFSEIPDENTTNSTTSFTAFEKTETPSESSNSGGSSFSPGLSKNIMGLLDDFPDGMPASKFLSAYQTKYGVPLDIVEKGFSSVKEMVAKCHDIFYYTEDPNRSGWLLFSASRKKNASNIPGTKMWIPNLILDNLAALAMKYSSGIPSNSILEFYEKEYGTKIDIRKLGFKSITSFLVNCPSIALEQKDDAYIVLPKEWAKLQTNQNSEPLPELAELQYLWQYFEPNFCDPKFCFKVHPLLENCVLGVYYKIVVAETTNPNCIFVHLSEEIEILETLMGDLNTYYNEEHDELNMVEGVVHPNQVCVAKFEKDNQWYRAQILERDDTTMSAKVQYIDYGTWEWVPFSYLRYLHKEYSKLHTLCIPVHLEGIPIYKPGTYTEPMIQFSQSILSETLIMEVVSYDEENLSLGVNLIKSDGSNDTLLNEYFLTHCVNDKGTQTGAGGNVSNKRPEASCVCARSLIYNMFLEHEEMVVDIWRSKVLECLPELEIELLSEILSKLGKGHVYKYLKNCSCSKDVEDIPFIASHTALSLQMEGFSASYGSEFISKKFKTVLAETTPDIAPQSPSFTPSQPNHVPSQQRLNQVVSPRDNTSQPRHVVSPQPQGVQMMPNGYSRQSENSNSTTTTDEPEIISCHILRSSLDIIRPWGRSDPDKMYCSVLHLLKSFSKNVTSKMLDHRLQSKGMVAPYVTLHKAKNPLLFQRLRSRNLVSPSSTELLVIPLEFLVEFISVVAPNYHKFSSVFEKVINQFKP